VSYRSKHHLLSRLLKKSFRDAYTEQHVKTSIPEQIRAIRIKRDWTQSELAERSKTTQTVIARVEDINYGNLSLNTLLKIASALDIGLLVKFVPYSRLVREFEDASIAAVNVPAFPDEVSALEHWAASEQQGQNAISISEGLRRQISGSDQASQRATAATSARPHSYNVLSGAGR
jgi:transcriptional regulator with XRE-family HTH domain